MSSGRHCDIFCTVIDNYGDIGVCWRLARHLYDEHAWQIRLWVDDLLPLSRLVPATQIQDVEQVLDGILVKRWDETFPDTEPADVVIEAFACDLPASYIRAMAARTIPPYWINLEYLSLEDWAIGCHGLPSPHPGYPQLQKYFFFPGMQTGTGGVLHEKSYAKRHQGHDVATFRRQFAAPSEALWISLFCYENPRLPQLLSLWAQATRPVVCLVTNGKAMQQVEIWLGEKFDVGSLCTRGVLHLHGLPMIPQQDFDQLLWSCDLNFVRGEDSFVRAQLAALPFIWHIYPQAENAHHTKLQAFLDTYAEGMTAISAAAMKNFQLLWNEAEESSSPALPQAWQRLTAALPDLRAHAGIWSQKLSSLGNLAENLAVFVENH